MALSLLPRDGISVFAESEGPTMPGPAARKLYSFDYQGVTLSPGFFRHQYDETRNFFLDLSNDDILKGYRANAGLPAPGADMGGWAQYDTSTTFGQWLSGMARMYRATNDRAMLDKASYLLAEWDKTFQAKGSPYYAYADKPAQSHYPFDKTMCGLVDLYFYGGNRDALRPMEQLRAWGTQHLSRKRGPATAQAMSGPVDGGIEWYTLAENLYRAYQVTGDAEYRTFADVWRYDSYWLQFSGGSDVNLRGLHAYSHVNTFSSAAMTYAVTGDPKYLTALRGAYDYFNETQFFATGGYGPGEQLVSADGMLGRSLDVEGNSFETPCGSWAGFKMARYLMEFTGESRYGDWIERLMYNGIGAALPMEDRENPFVKDTWSHNGLNGGYHVAERGKTFYYADYRAGGGRKDYFPEAWPCCSGTYIQDVADYHNLIYFHGPETLCVNLYIPSEVTWKLGSETVRLTQETAYPASRQSRFVVKTDQPRRFAINLRVPGWASGMTFQVNGAAVSVPARPGTWAAVDRVWNDGDTLVTTMDWRLREIPIDRQHPRRVALADGPVVLVQRQQSGLPAGVDNLKKSGGANSPRSFSSTSSIQSVFVPFYSVAFGEPYAMYADL
jgi:hypothetical protein